MSDPFGIQRISTSNINNLLSPEDVGILVTQTLSDSSDISNEKLKKDLDLNVKKTQALLNIGNLISQLLFSFSAPITKATVGSIDSVADDFAKLQSVFNRDGTRIGDTFSESEDSLVLLKEMGLDILADAQIPTLVKRYAENKVLISEEVAWVSPSDREQINSIFPSKPSSKYTGANEVIFSAGQETYNITFFDENKNFRVSKDSLNLAVENISQTYKSILADLNYSLKNISSESDAIEKIREKVAELSYDFEKSTSENKESLVQILDEIRKRLVILKNEIKMSDKYGDLYNFSKSELNGDFIKNFNSDLKNAIFAVSETKKIENIVSETSINNISNNLSDDSNIELNSIKSDEFNIPLLLKKISTDIEGMLPAERKINIRPTFRNYENNNLNDAQSNFPLDWKLRALRNLQEV